jgi:hypothetical protein
LSEAAGCLEELAGQQDEAPSAAALSAVRDLSKRIALAQEVPPLVRCP